MWNGGIADPTSSMMVAGANATTSGKFNFCRFYVGNALTTAPQSISWYNINGYGNTWPCANQAPGTQYGTYAWQTGSGSVAAFCSSNTGYVFPNGAKGGFLYVNEYFCAKLLPNNIAAGATLTMYVYSPFWDGKSGVYRIVPTEFTYTNPGLHLESVHASTSATGEIKLVWRNVSGAAINTGAGVGLDFMFIHGVP